MGERARIRMVVAELTLADGEVTGVVETSITEGGRTVTQRREIGAVPTLKGRRRPKPPASQDRGGES